MEETPLSLLFLALAVLILMSGFFSGSETGMMSLNRYRLRHLAKHDNRPARRVLRLLERPDRLIGVILIGNNFVNIVASAIATVIAIRLLGDKGIAVATLLLTLVILIFSEVTPKTLAATRPEAIAFPASLVLTPLLKLIYPFVWLVNAISNGLLRALGAGSDRREADELSSEELRTVLHETGSMIPRRHKTMLLSVLDLEHVTVDDIMIPRQDIIGIDIDDDTDYIFTQLRASQHTRLPVYRGEVDNTVGMLHLRKLSRLLAMDSIDRDTLLSLVAEPYFVPQGTPLHTQLVKFQQARRRVGLVVDEYGDVLGMVTLEDILEEIVGEFTTDFAATTARIQPQADGTYFVDGSATIREINRGLHWQLPTNGPKTLSGLLVEELEAIPDAPVCLQIGAYRVEIKQMKGNTIKTARIEAEGDETR